MREKGLVWVDVLTPKQFWFFTSLEEKLRRVGYEVLVTARAYEQLTPLLEYSGRSDVVVVGFYGGETLAGKLEASLKRGLELLRILDGKNPCLVFSSGSPEAARIAYGLQIPHILASDTPESPVNKLVAPVSKLVFTPWVVGTAPWLMNGASRKTVKLYKGLDPLAWIKKTQNIEDIKAKYGLEKHEYILVRSPEFKAAYLNLEYMHEYIAALKKLRKTITGYKLVVMPRYTDEASKIRKEFSSKDVVIIDKPAYGSAIIADAALFIGGGGTMTQEAALLGIPTLSVYPKPLPAVLRYLEKQKLITRARNSDTLARIVKVYLDNLHKVTEASRRRASRIIQKLENPVESIVGYLRRAGILS